MTAYKRRPTPEERRKQVMKAKTLLHDGLPFAVIAERLGISRTTLRSRIQKVGKAIY